MAPRGRTGVAIKCETTPLAFGQRVHAAYPLSPHVLSAQAPAKVNLGLQVLRRRHDGFHDLATVFLPIGWADTLTAEPSSRLTLTTTDSALPTDDSNLVVRAAQALAAWADLEGGARLHLEKRVPYGAGLGGGSSDAATTLRLLTELWDLDVPPGELAQIALVLGSDVPFFLEAEPSLGTSRGEVLTPVLEDGYACPFWLVVAVPPVHVSTAQAFAGVVPTDLDRPGLAAAVASNDLERWRLEVTNDFQPSVEAAHPVIADVRRALEDGGAGWAALSGTGSAVVSAFQDEATARRAASDLEAECRVWVEPPRTVSL